MLYICLLIIEKIDYVLSGRVLSLWGTGSVLEHGFIFNFFVFKHAFLYFNIITLKELKY